MVLLGYCWFQFDTGWLGCLGSLFSTFKQIHLLLDPVFDGLCHCTLVRSKSFSVWYKLSVFVVFSCFRLFSFAQISFVWDVFFVLSSSIVDSTCFRWLSVFFNAVWNCFGLLFIFSVVFGCFNFCCFEHVQNLYRVHMSLVFFFWWRGAVFSLMLVCSIKFFVVVIVPDFCKSFRLGVWSLKNVCMSFEIVWGCFVLPGPKILTPWCSVGFGILSKHQATHGV